MLQSAQVRRNDFLARHLTTKLRKIQSADIGGKRSFMPLTQPSCQLEIASRRTKLSSPTFPYLILRDSKILTPARVYHQMFFKILHSYGFDDRKLKEEYNLVRRDLPKAQETGNDRRPKETPPSTASSNDDINRENFITVLKVLSKFNLQSAFPELYTVYKSLLTLPIGSTKCERTFSKLKFVKNNLRSTMGQKRLNSLMVINVERDLTKALDYEKVINSFADTPLLQNMLRY